jgi:hypothetical protein
MKREYKIMKHLTLATVVAFTLIGCGGSSEDDWGIDNEAAVEVSHGPLDETTQKFRCELSDADEVKAGGLVTPLTDDTEIRVWHFQNSEEYVCTLKGQAIIQQPAGV